MPTITPEVITKTIPKIAKPNSTMGICHLVDTAKTTGDAEGVDIDVGFKI